MVYIKKKNFDTQNFRTRTIKLTGIDDDILEKKYKILRTSILLGNIKDREEVLNNYAKATREVDLLRNNAYEEEKVKIGKQNAEGERSPSVF